MKGESLAKAFSGGDRASKAADAMEGEVSITLTDTQRDALAKFVERSGRLPSTLEINFQAGVERNTLIPVTVLVGAMT